MALFKFWRRHKAPSITAGVISDVGRIRPNNEDNYVLGRHINSQSANHSAQLVYLSAKAGNWQLAGVFDGMGGGEAGELASREAAKIFLQSISQCAGDSREMLEQSMREAFQRANNKTLELQKQYQVFGTTGTVLCTDGEIFKIFHLGDSRCYLLRDGVLSQLTKDQTLAQMKMEVGMYDPSDPQAEQDKHKLTEFIGRDWSGENLRPLESVWSACSSGDRFLLCSDGLYDMCADSQILQILQQELPLGDVLQQMADAANDSGGVDNITCVILKIA